MTLITQASNAVYHSKRSLVRQSRRISLQITWRYATRKVIISIDHLSLNPRQPMYDVVSAIDVLSVGRYRRLPGVIRVILMFFTRVTVENIWCP